MPVRVGDVVHMFGWELHSGPYVNEYVLKEIASDHISIEHVAVYRDGQKYTGNQQIEKRERKLLEYFEVPLKERLKHNQESLVLFTIQVVGETQKFATDDTN